MLTLLILYLYMSMNRLELLLGLGCLSVGLAELDLHLIEVSLHLLLYSQGLIPASGLCFHSTLQDINGPLQVPLVLLHLLILFSQLALNLSLHLVKLKLGSQNLSFLVFKRSLGDMFELF